MKLFKIFNKRQMQYINHYKPVKFYLQSATLLLFCGLYFYLEDVLGISSQSYVYLKQIMCFVLNKHSDESLISKLNNGLELIYIQFYEKEILQGRVTFIQERDYPYYWFSLRDGSSVFPTSKEEIMLMFHFLDEVILNLLQVIDLNTKEGAERLYHELEFVHFKCEVMGIPVFKDQVSGEDAIYFRVRKELMQTHYLYGIYYEELFSSSRNFSFSIKYFTNILGTYHSYIKLNYFLIIKFILFLHLSLTWYNILYDYFLDSILISYITVSVFVFFIYFCIGKLFMRFLL